MFVTTMNEIETASTKPMIMQATRGVDGYIFDPSNPLGFTTGGSAGPADFVMEPMPEGLAKIINYLDGPAAPSISAPASIAEPAHGERDFVDDQHKLLLFAGVTTLLLFIFRVHN